MGMQLHMCCNGRHRQLIMVYCIAICTKGMLKAVCLFIQLGITLLPNIQRVSHNQENSCKNKSSLPISLQL